jgi:hypothetical protein
MNRLWLIKRPTSLDPTQGVTHADLAHTHH